VMLEAQTPEQGLKKTESVLEQLGLDVDCKDLQSVDIERLLKAGSATRGVRNPLAAGDPFSPVLGPSLPDHPRELIRKGNAEAITVVTGCTTDEMLSFLYSDPDLWALGIEDTRNRLRSILGEDAGPIVASYQAAAPGRSPTSILLAVATAFKFWIPHIRMAEAKTEDGGAPVYMYSFAWGRPDPIGTPRSGHGSDMPYFFDNVEKASIAAGPHAKSLTKAMSGSLIALARAGDPNHDAVPDWPAYTAAERSTMRFDVPPSIEHDPQGAERSSWRGITLAGLRAG
jgi:para-nitrobenzyl esterase